jgi:hypothetical protein
MLFDAVHTPFGCSVWSGFWTQGSNWPNDGEVDILEGVNKQTQNRMSLHTGNNCQHPSQDDFSSAPSSKIPFKETGSVTSTDCYNQTNLNEGCVITDSRSSSYGQDFNGGGGGVYAMLRDSQGIRIWFWPRGSFPSDVQSGNQTVDPSSSGWGDPAAYFPVSSCQTDFGLQSIYLVSESQCCHPLYVRLRGRTDFNAVCTTAHRHLWPVRRQSRHICSNL